MPDGMPKFEPYALDMRIEGVDPDVIGGRAVEAPAVAPAAAPVVAAPVGEAAREECVEDMGMIYLSPRSSQR
jgi:hypothetical protein